MTQKSPTRLLARLTELRARKEDQARQKLALGQARQAAAADKLGDEEARLQKMQGALPVYYKLHLRQIEVLERPVDRFATLVSAIQGDRAVLAEQAQQTDTARTDCDQALAEVEALRLAYLQTLRQRQATEALRDVHGRTARRRKASREEDLVADVALGNQQGATK